MQTLPAEQSARIQETDRVEAANLLVVTEDGASAEIRQLYQQFREDFGRPRCLLI